MQILDVLSFKRRFLKIDSNIFHIFRSNHFFFLTHLWKKSFQAFKTYLIWVIAEHFYNTLKFHTDTQKYFYRFCVIRFASKMNNFFFSWVSSELNHDRHLKSWLEIIFLNFFCTFLWQPGVKGCRRCQG